MASVALRVLALAAMALVSSQPPRAAAEDSPPAAGTQTVTSSDGSESFQLPAAWTLESNTVKGADGAWRATVPGGANCNILLHRRFASRDEVLSTSALAWNEPRPAGARFVTKPVPHVTFDVRGPKDAEWKRCFSVRVVRRRGYGLVMEAPKTDFDAILPAFLDAVRSFQSTRSQLPDVPDDWKKVARDGYEYFLQPGRNEADVGPLHKYLLQQEASFAKRYGPVPKRGDNPIVVLLVQQVADAEAAGFDVKDKDRDVTWSVDGNCMLVSSAVTGDLAANVGLAGTTCFALENQTFGVAMPRWVSSGESALRIFEATSGHALPQYSESMAKGLPRSLLPLRELAKNPGGDASLIAMVYVAYLRTSPRPYADKFAAYIKAVRSGADPEAAFSDFLDAVVGAKFKTDAEAFLASFKPVKSK